MQNQVIFHAQLREPVLKTQPVSAVELLDRRSMRSVQDKPGMPAFVQQLSEGACALLIESRAASPSLLHEQLALSTPPQNLTLSIVEAADHNEAAWRAEFPRVVLWLHGLQSTASALPAD